MHQQAFWRKLFDLLQPRKKSTTNCCEMMLKLHLQDPRHHSYTPSLPFRGQSCCLMHSTTSRSLRVVISTTVYGFRFAHLVCQYCFVSPKTAWQTDRLEGRKQVQSCSFGLDIYTAVSHMLQFRHSLRTWVTCDRNMNFFRSFRKFACF